MEQRLLYPSLILIYSGIDAVAALSAPAEKFSVESRFTSWVDRYLLSIKSLRARSIDLYAARCGLLHTLTSDAALIDKGRAVAVSYTWGNADPEILQGMIDRTIPGRTVAVRVRDLAAGFRLGMIRTIEDASVDDISRTRMGQHATRLFAQRPSNPQEWRQSPGNVV